MLENSVYTGAGAIRSSCLQVIGDICRFAVLGHVQQQACQMYCFDTSIRHADSPKSDACAVSVQETWGFLQVMCLLEMQFCIECWTCASDSSSVASCPQHRVKLGS